MQDMALKKVAFKSGFNKQTTPSGADGQWIDGDNTRFRYGQPEKIGGWQELNASTLAGPARAQITWTSIDGRKYAAIGTSKVLVIFYEGQFYDITPLNVAITGCTFDSTTGSSTVTVNSTAHNLSTGEYIKFSSVTLPSGGETTYTTADFTTDSFEILSASANSFTITMATTEAGSGMSGDGDASIQSYITIGPAFESYGYGFGTGKWGSYVGGMEWGEESDASAGTSLSPGSWSLDNYGQVLVATVKNGKTYTWDPAAVDRLNTRATIMVGAPTKSITSIVSDRDRHFILLGTETTVGDPSTFDPMFIRFSNQEDYNTYAPKATNTAGTFRLDTGNSIIAAVQGKDYILILTDQAAYIMQYVGTPFTFSIRQVGTNFGCVGLHGLVYAQGSVFWMGFGGGFFTYDGTVKQLPSLVEDFVFSISGNNLGLNFNAGDLVYAGHNSLFNEVTWYYPSAKLDANSTVASEQINRSVTFNFGENVWTTGTLSRTTYSDSQTYDLPYATQYSKTGVPTFPVINGVTNQVGSSRYWSHETGVNQVDFAGVETAINSSILSGDFEIADGGSNAELFMAVRRFIPDFKNLQGNCNVTLYLRDYPANSTASSTLGPFTISSSTAKVDTRARSRLMAIEIGTDSTDATWTYGTLRLDIQVDGRR
jgi:hypothetical protein